jgi:hypothetical protein
MWAECARSRLFRFVAIDTDDVLCIPLLVYILLHPHLARYTRILSLAKKDETMDAFLQHMPDLFPNVTHLAIDEEPLTKGIHGSL